MNTTTIQMETPELLWVNVVGHDCTCGEFLQNIREEVKRYLLHNPKASNVDVFWHLDEYCDDHIGYEPCHWQKVTVGRLIYESQREDVKVPGEE